MYNRGTQYDIQLAIMQNLGVQKLKLEIAFYEVKIKPFSKSL